MRSLPVARRTACVALLWLAYLPASADVISVGSGPSFAYLTFDFTDVGGAFYDFKVSFDDSVTAMTGEALLIALFTDPAVGGSVVSTTSPTSPTLPAGVAPALGLKYFDFDGDLAFTDALVHSVRVGSDTGLQDDVDFDPTWAYWTRESTSVPFSESFTGISSRVVTTGDHDAFVFGSFGGPPTFPAPGPPTTAVPEPSSLALAALAAAGAIRRASRTRKREAAA